MSQEIPLNNDSNESLLLPLSSEKLETGKQHESSANEMIPNVDASDQDKPSQTAESTTQETNSNDGGADGLSTPRDGDKTDHQSIASSGSDSLSQAAAAAAQSPLSWTDAAKLSNPSSNRSSLTITPKPPQNENHSFTDATMLEQVEINAKQSASSLVHLVHHLRTQLQNLSSLSVQYMKVHKMSIEGVVTEVDFSIQSVSILIEKAISLNAELKKIYSIHQEIKDIKKLLSQLEKNVDKLTSK